MPLVVNSNKTDSIELEELIDFCERELDTTCHDSMEHAGDALKRLANNRTFLSRFVLEEIKSYDQLQQNNGYIPPVIMLHRDPRSNFFLRANIWPADSDDIMDLGGHDTFFYDYPHDHNFNFLTVGYFGPGYLSDYYEYENDEVAGYPGEQVPSLRYIETSALEQGKMLLYRAFRDVHTQLPPKALSISLNIMEQTLRTAVTDQYGFDIESNAISKIVNRNNAVSLIGVGAALGSENCLDVIDHLSLHHPQPRVRFEAIRALASVNTDLTEKIETMAGAAKDPSMLVRNWGAIHIQRLREIAERA